MAINPAAVCSNDNMIFTPGEVVISINLGINLKIKVLAEHGGQLIISERTKRKVLVRHAVGLMKAALKIDPSLEIDIDDNKILKHCGFGSSSSTLAGICAGINELYGRPIKNKLLIQYLASNHGEEVSDNDIENLKAVQCIGGGATGGLTKEGIILIAGKSTVIAKMNYRGMVLIGVPRDFKVKDADLLMRLEEKNLYKFKATGEKYKDIIAYNLLHKALPEMTNGEIRALADIVYEYRFNMGSNENCAFVFDRIKEISQNLKHLYTNKHCEFLALSSVGPAFFVIVKNKKDRDYCIKAFEKENMKVYETAINNKTYQVLNREDF